MYGTIARLRIKPGAEEAFMRMTRDFAGLSVPGYMSTYVYQMDADPRECYMAVVFESKAAYDANAESAEQDARYRQMAALLEGEPDWHDGEIIATSSAS